MNQEKDKENHDHLSPLVDISDEVPSETEWQAGAEDRLAKSIAATARDYPFRDLPKRFQNALAHAAGLATKVIPPKDQRIDWSKQTDAEREALDAATSEPIAKILDEVGNKSDLQISEFIDKIINSASFSLVEKEYCVRRLIAELVGLGHQRQSEIERAGLEEQKKELLTKPPQEQNIPKIVRITPEMNAAFGAAAEKEGLDVESWMKSALENAVQQTNTDPVETQGKTKPTRSRRSQRTREALPDPSKPPAASVNRYDKQIMVRMSPNEIKAINAAVSTKGLDRKAWFAEALDTFTSQRGILLGDEADEKVSLTKPVGWRFDPIVLEKTDQTAKALNLTRAEFMRRLSHWHLSSTELNPTPKGAAPSP